MKYTISTMKSVIFFSDLCRTLWITNKVSPYCRRVKELKKKKKKPMNIWTGCHKYSLFGMLVPRIKWFVAWIQKCFTVLCFSLRGFSYLDQANFQLKELKSYYSPRRLSPLFKNWWQTIDHCICIKDGSSGGGELYLENSHMQTPKVISWNKTNSFTSDEMNFTWFPATFSRTVTEDELIRLCSMGFKRVYFLS